MTVYFSVNEVKIKNSIALFSGSLSFCGLLYLCMAVWKYFLTHFLFFLDFDNTCLCLE